MARNLVDAKALGRGDFSVAAGGRGRKGGAECLEMGLGSFGITPFCMGDGLWLVVETDESESEESRLKAGCSQDWPPHISEDIH
jgi:hypothetical protein